MSLYLVSRKEQQSKYARWLRIRFDAPVFIWPRVYSPSISNRFLSWGSSAEIGVLLRTGRIDAARSAGCVT